MKFNLFIIFGFLTSSLFSQSVSKVSQSFESDSSFYHIEKVYDNEFWIGGEYGILKSIDTLGNISNVYGFINEGRNILVIKKVGNEVYVGTDNALIYCYNLITRTWQCKKISQFENRCFYDLVELSDGKILVCGGSTKIAAGSKKIPYGFVGVLNYKDGEIEVIWKRKLKFVWSLIEKEKQLYIAVFNGFNSKIKSTSNFEKWRTLYKIKGLVHEINLFDNEIWFSGTNSIDYNKNGIYGRLIDGKNPRNNSSAGCVWSMSSLLNNKFGVTSCGGLLDLNNDQLIKFENAFVLYDLEFISIHKILIVGHGKGVYFYKL